MAREPVKIEGRLRTKRCQAVYVYLANSQNGHILAEHILPQTLRPALNYFFPTYGFARNVDELDETNYHGANPKRLKPELREAAYQTKTNTHHYKEQLQKTKFEDSFSIAYEIKGSPTPIS